MLTHALLQDPAFLRHVVQTLRSLFLGKSIFPAGIPGLTAHPGNPQASSGAAHGRDTRRSRGSAPLGMASFRA